ncbi:MAG: PilZ domain-containing protein [Planctomycetota bacterium]
MRRAAALRPSLRVPRGNTPGRTRVQEHGRLRRMARRTPYRVPCRVRLVDPTTGEVRTIAGQTVNISSGGLSLHVAVETPPGTWVETLLPHPNGEPLFVCGRVVHVRRTMTANFEVGVETESPAEFA